MLTIRVSGVACEALQLDDRQMYVDLTLIPKRTGAGFSYFVTASVFTWGKILADANDRAANPTSGEGYDQPYAWKRACKATAAAIIGAASSAQLCECGHTGNAKGTQHGSRYAYGHGPCVELGCGCKQFTWSQRIALEAR